MGDAAAVKRVEQRWRDCKRCALCEDRTQVVFWRGHVDARLAVIGEAPGEDEDRTGQPFVGESGRLFDRLCESALPQGPEPWSYFIANMVGCRPPRNRRPLPEEWEQCRGRLYAMLMAVRPRAVLLLGGTALEYLTGLERITKVRGKVLKVEVPWKRRSVTLQAVPTLHPGFLLRNQRDDLQRIVVADIRQAWELAQDGSWLEGD